MQDTIEGAGFGFLFVIAVAGTITVALVALIFLPLIAPLVILIFGPFRKNLRWPKATRKMTALSFLCMIPWNLDPNWYRVKEALGQLPGGFLELISLVFLIGAIIIVPATIVMCLITNRKA